MPAHATTPEVKEFLFFFATVLWKVNNIRESFATSVCNLAEK